MERCTPSLDSTLSLAVLVILVLLIMILMLKVPTILPSATKKNFRLTYEKYCHDFGALSSPNSWTFSFLLLVFLTVAISGHFQKDFR